MDIQHKPLGPKISDATKLDVCMVSNSLTFWLLDCTYFLRLYWLLEILHIQGWANVGV